MNKADLLGQVTKLSEKEGCKARISKMRNFEWEEGVCHLFCAFCGVQLEINRELASELAEMAGIPLPEDLRNYYFELRRCFMCSGALDGARLVAIFMINSIDQGFKLKISDTDNRK